MQKHWSIEEYREYQKKGNKKSKYGAIKTSVDGHTFDSKKEAEMLQENISPTKKPDADNIIKIVLDAMNKFAFNDDTQVTKLEIEKKYDKAPRIYIRIEEY